MAVFTEPVEIQDASGNLKIKLDQTGEISIYGNDGTVFVLRYVDGELQGAGGDDGQRFVDLDANSATLHLGKVSEFGSGDVVLFDKAGNVTSQITGDHGQVVLRSWAAGMDGKAAILLQGEPGSVTLYRPFGEVYGESVIIAPAEGKVVLGPGIGRTSS